MDAVDGGGGGLSLVGSVRDAPWLELTMVACFILTGQGSMNGHQARLAMADTDRFECGAVGLASHSV